MRIGVPKEYRVDGMPQETEDLWQRGIAWLKSAGATIHDKCRLANSTREIPMSSANR